MSDGLNPPLNAPPGTPPAVGVQPGVSGQIVRAREVIISGASGGLLVYNGAAAFGNLILAIVGMAGLDPYGNAIPNPGLTSFDPAASPIPSVNANGGGFSWATASTAAGPWTTVGELGINVGAPTNLVINFASWTHPP